MREDDKVYTANITNKTATKGAELQCLRFESLSKPQNPLSKLDEAFGKS